MHQRHAWPTIKRSVMSVVRPWLQTQLGNRRDRRKPAGSQRTRHFLTYVDFHDFTDTSPPHLKRAKEPVRMEAGNSLGKRANTNAPDGLDSSRRVYDRQDMMQVSMAVVVLENHAGRREKVRRIC